MAWTWKKRYSDRNGDAVISSTSHLPPSPNNGDHARISEAWTQAPSELALKVKEAEVKQHAKVAEEAVAGWEKAEAETESMRRQLELVQKEKAAQQERLSHLDAALKDCTRQVRLVREDQEQKRQELLHKKNKEVDKIRAEYEAKLADVGRQLLEAGAENKVMAMTLQEHARTIGEVTDAKSRAEAEIKLLQHRMESVEKEKGALKYEVHVLNKQIQIRNEERDYSKRDIEALNRQHAEDTKVMNKLEAECQKLRILVRRKLPGPNALAQMKMEVESLDGGGESKRRGTRSSTETKLHQNGSREIELLLERLLSMEEETKMLKEALAQRNGELHSSRLICAKTATKLSAMEAYFDSVSRTHGLSKPKVNGIDADCSPSVVTVSENGTADDEVSRADAWASALIAELSQFRKDKPSPNSMTSEAISSPSTFGGIMDDFTDMEKLASELTSEKASLDEVTIMEVPAARKLEQDFEKAEGALKPQVIQDGGGKEVTELQLSISKVVESLAGSLGLLSPGDNSEMIIDGGLEARLQKMSPQPSVEPAPSLQEFVSELLGALEIISSAVSSKKHRSSAVEVLDCETQTCNGDDKLELELVRIEKNALESHMKSELSRLTAMEGEVLQLRSDKVQLQQGLDAGNQELEASKAQLQEAQHLIQELQTKLSLSVPDGTKEEAMVVTEVESQVRSSGSLMQDAVSRLEKELEEEYKHHEEDKARSCRKEQQESAVQAEEAEDDRRTRKGEEIAEAEAKLAECQKTILALGKQLKVLSSSPRREANTNTSTNADSIVGSSRANSMLSVLRNFSESDPEEEMVSRDVTIATPVNESYIPTLRQDHDEEQDAGFPPSSPLMMQRGGAGSSSPATKARRSSFSRFFRAKNSA
ncbi:filament-like plant protein 4 isoform X1 [Selaginella moellendorffii]|uniref:filament-like plant protein 4 isoform X1 n=1 Tax=Selaginella moellendorffii TaxID=88036 RepID=UPI000D1C5DAA|nr:filament-like plant protein 4 isoform X1 [Selaginella moellendorffii]|eukprot:XP_024521347.1 filament-like plant protein 4 isoform X1 [Selaginella moellendorffii]